MRRRRWRDQRKRRTGHRPCFLCTAHPIDIHPDQRPAGTVITVTGTGFTGLNAACIGAAHNATVTVVSDTRATITVPQDGVSGPVAVINPQHSATSIASFTFAEAVIVPQPVISSFTPGSGVVGVEIELKGSGFTGLTAASIGSSQGAALNVSTDTLVEVHVPNDAVTGPIKLLNSQHSVLSSTVFTVLPAMVSVPLSIHAMGMTSPMAMVS